MKSNLNLNEMAELLGVSHRAFKRIILELGIAKLQSEAERIQAVERWDKCLSTECLTLGANPEIKHFKEALQNLID